MDIKMDYCYEKFINRKWVLMGSLDISHDYDVFALLTGKEWLLRWECSKVNWTHAKPMNFVKGFPDDVTERVLHVAAQIEDFECRGSFWPSWLNLNEILKYNAVDNKTIKEGYVDLEVYHDFKKTGNPYPHYKHVIPFDANMLVVDPKKEDPVKVQEDNPEKEISCYIQWEECVRYFAKEFYEEVNTKLIPASDSPLYDDIRIIYWGSSGCFK